jgi:ribosomal protein S12 methylthiotransferase accessory factor
MPNIAKLAVFFEQIEVKPDGCPAFFAIALPSSRLTAQWPNFPVAATPQAGRMANGRGLTQVACTASCLGEAAELASCCVWGDEKFVRASALELGADALTPERLLGLTPRQQAAREAWNEQWGAFDWRPVPCAPDAPLDWMQVQEVYTGEARFAPADAVLIGRREAGDTQAVAIADSNGCASADGMAVAKASAVQELIERDALARWWYGRRARPVVDISDIEGGTPLITYLLERARICRLFDITTDLGIPAFAAVSAEADGSDVAIGSSASHDADQAALSALLEMLQMEISLEIARRAGSEAATWDAWRRTVSMATPPLSLATAQIPLPRQPTSKQGPEDPLSLYLDACATAQVSLYYYDMTRSQLGIPTVRALSTDLCHFKPRFARTRLLARDPRDCGCSDDALAEPNPSLLLV